MTQDNSSRSTISLGSFGLYALLIVGALITHDVTWIYVGLWILGIQFVVVLLIMPVILVIAMRK